MSAVAERRTVQLVSLESWRRQLLCYLRLAHHPLKIVQLLQATDDGLAEETQHELLSALQDPLVQLSAKPAYQLSLLKRLAAAIQEAGQELTDELASLYGDALCLPAGDSNDNWGLKTFAYSSDGNDTPESSVAQQSENVRQMLRGPQADGDTPSTSGMEGLPAAAATPPVAAAAAAAKSAASGFITLRVSGNLLEGSTGCHEWEAGFVLGEFILSNPHLFKGKHCLELGCGSGLAGVCLSRAGAAAVALTDGSPAAIANCDLNLRMNGVPSRLLHEAEELGLLQQGVACCAMPWEAAPEGLLYDVVLGADVLYDPGALSALTPAVVPLLVRLLQRLLQRGAPGGGASEAYVATMRRNPATLLLFLTETASCGLALTQLDTQGWMVAFQHVPALEHRDQVVLHRVVTSK